MFDPTVGQWFTEDPKGFDAGDSNLRRVVGNNTTNVTDPSGLFPPGVDKEFATQAHEAWKTSGRSVSLAEKAIFRIAIEPLFGLSPKQSDAILASVRVASPNAAQHRSDAAIDQFFQREEWKDHLGASAMKYSVKQARNKLYHDLLASGADAMTLPTVIGAPGVSSLIISKDSLISSPTSEREWNKSKRLFVLDDNGFKALALMGHELSHAAQEYISVMRHNDGGMTFLLDYIAQYELNQESKIPARRQDPYRAITYEVVGYAVGEALEKLFAYPKMQTAFEKSIAAEKITNDLGIPRFDIPELSEAGQVLAQDVRSVFKQILREKCNLFQMSEERAMRVI